MIKRGQPSSWYFDFRITQALPDIKFIRTNFVLNALSLIFFLVVAVVFMHHYMVLSEQVDEVVSLQTQINVLSKSNKESLVASAQFKERVKALKEFSAFYAYDLFLASLLEDLARDCPEELNFETLSYVFKNEVDGGAARGGYAQQTQAQKSQERVPRVIIMISGAVKGSAQEALVLLDDYKRLLKSMSIFGRYIEAISVVPKDRTENSQLVSFSISINLKLDK